MVHARSRSRAVTAFVLIVMCIGASFAACADLRRSNGDECIKSEECASLICESMKCVAQPPLFNGTPTGDDQSDSAPAVDSGSKDSGSSTKDTGAGADSGDDGPPQDALNDVVDEASGDALAQNDGAESDGSLDANDANDIADVAATTDGSADALSDASDAANDADLFDAALDVNLDVNVPDVLGG